MYQAPDTDTKRRSSVYNFNDDFDDSNASDNGYDTDIEIESLNSLLNCFVYEYIFLLIMLVFTCSILLQKKTFSN